MFLKHTKWAMLWALLIFILCAIPGKDLPNIGWLEIFQFDKFVHASLFFVQSVLLIWGFSKQESISILKLYKNLFSIFICIAYGGLLELMQQAFFADRTADIYDFIANTFGSILGLFFYKKAEQSFLIKFIK